MFLRNETAKRYILAIAAAVAFQTPVLGYGQGKSAPPVEQSDKIDVTELENKYWAAKDTDFSVVQNRLFSKSGRLTLNTSYGSIINDSWSDGPTLGATLSYYFSDRYGVSLQYSQTDSVDNKATQNLRSQSGFPNHNKMKTYYGASFNWVPFYAKMSLLNASIMYFDMAISPGLGLTHYEQQVEAGNVVKSAPTLSLDVTQKFFLNNHVALRLDVLNRWYQQDIVPFRSNSTLRTTTTDLNQTSILMFGVNLFY